MQDKSGEDKIALLDSIIDKDAYRNPELCLLLADDLAEAYRLKGNLERYHYVKYGRKGFIYKSAGNLLQALQHFEAYAEYFQAKSENDAYFLIDLGNIYYDLKLYQIAWKYYERAEPIFRRLDNNRGLGTVLGNYSLVHRRRGHLDSALFYLDKTITLQLAKVDDKFQIAHSYLLRGQLMNQDFVQPDSALPSLYQALDYISDEALKKHLRYEQFAYLLPEISLELGRAYYLLSRPDSGQYYLEQAQRTCRALGQDYRLIKLLNRQGDILLNYGQYGAEVEAWFLEAKALAEKTNNQEYLELIYLGLSQLYEYRGNTTLALLYLNKHRLIRDALQIKEDELLLLNQQILEYERNRTIAEQDKVILAEAQLRRNLFWIILLASALALLLGFVAYNRAKNHRLILGYSQDLERQYYIKERLLLIIGHDLRSVFNVILAYTRQMYLHINQSNSERLTKEAQKVEQAARRAFMLVDGLMQWASLEKAQMKVENKPFRLRDCVEETLNQLSSASDLQGLSIIQDIEDWQLNADPRLLAVVLRNLLTNAIKHSPVDGAIYIRSREEAGQCYLEVEDQGPGIPPERLGNLFQKQSGLEVAQKGSGLGLEIVQQLVGLLGLEVSAYNRSESGGAVFRLTLPQVVKHEQRFASEIYPPALDLIEAISPQDLQQLSPLVAQLQNLAVYEGSKIRRQLQGFSKDRLQSPAAQVWLSQLNQAVSLADELLYQQQLEKINRIDAVYRKH